MAEEEKAAQPSSFEEAYALLDEYTRRMSAQDIALEESIELYERSARLIDFCQKCIERAELRIETLESEKNKGSAEEKVNE